MSKINYGIDAPKVIRNLLVIGLILLACAFLPADWFPPVSAFLHNSALAPAISLLAGGLLMYAYATFGKTRHRNRMLNLYDWKGNEQVLDVGTGLGLLMIGAAKRLTTGKATGIDIFNKYDLSDNTIEQLQVNTELENVADKVEIVVGNILKTDFETDHFDVIVSNLCLHNLYKAGERRQACDEINRILKPGGKAIISDFKHTSQYSAVFTSLDMHVQKKGTYFFTTFPPLTIIIVTKK